MNIQNCLVCGGTHFGSTKCPYNSAPCAICGDATILACADCGIDSAGEVIVHVCVKDACRDQHEASVHKRS